MQRLWSAGIAVALKPGAVMIAGVIRESIVELVFSGLMVAGVLSAAGLLGMAVAKIWSWLRAESPSNTIRIEIHIRS